MGLTTTSQQKTIQRMTLKEISFAYIRLTRATMDRPNEGRRIRAPPRRFRQVVRLFGVGLQQMLDGTGNLPHGARHGPEIHLIVLVANLFGQTAGPRLDLVELALLFVVPRLADIHHLVIGQSARAALGVAGNEHHEASVLNFFDPVVAILACLDHLVLVKELVIAMDRLFWAIKPAGVHPLLTRLVRPHAVDLRDYGLGKIVRVTDMNPITYSHS